MKKSVSKNIMQTAQLSELSRSSIFLCFLPTSFHSSRTTWSTSAPRIRLRCPWAGPRTFFFLWSWWLIYKRAVAYLSCFLQKLTQCFLISCVKTISKFFVLLALRHSILLLLRLWVLAHKYKHRTEFLLPSTTPTL